MEQASQKITQKPTMTTKTKIAVWWMTIIGGIYFLWFLYAVIRFFFPSSSVSSPIIIPMPPEDILLSLAKFTLPVVFGFLFPGIFLLLFRKKWTLFFTIIILIITNILFLQLNNNLHYFIISIPPFLLVFFDRKNFWKVAT